MILEIMGSRLAMLLQNELWNDISAFLHQLLDPIFIAFQDDVLRRTLLSTIIWSCIVICGLVFVVYEFPSVISLLMGTQRKPIKAATRQAGELRTQAESTSASRRQISKEKAQKEREKREKALRETGVRVTSKLVREHELIRLTVGIKNGSTSHIDMVVVDLNLPQGIDPEIGSFRMQRLGTINAGESKSVDFILRPVGGNPAELGGYVEFLGDSYEVSKIPLPAPIMEGIDSE